MKQHIVLIAGSGSVRSHTVVMLEHIAELLHKQGLKTTIWDLEQKSLPFLDANFHEDPDYPDETVREFKSLIERADGIVLGSPLYHGSFSGRLKNALDQLDGDAFKMKPVGLISNAGGIGNMQACEHLRSVVRALYGHALQTQIVSTEDDFEVLGEQKKLINKSIKKRCKRLVEELVTFTNFFQQSKFSSI